MAERLWRGGDLVRTMGWQGVRTRVDRRELIRARRGVYADRELDEEGNLRALFLRLPPQAILTRQSAARRYGVDVHQDGNVHIQLPPGVARPRLPGLVVHHAALAVREPVIVGGIPCVPAARCAVDLARVSSRMNALPVLDAMLRLGVIDHDGLCTELAQHRALKGIRQARELVRLSDGRAECRQESQLRLTLVDGRLPPPEPQVWVYDADGIARYRLDLGYRKRRVGVEYDGSSHLDRDRLRWDRERTNWLDAHGWTMRYFTDRDLYRRPAYIIATVRAALT
ncbi:DUF559 domain-containing protein [Plantactinospora siamensis]|uniref:DUF559 domain-containing protein n=1 Tax=Plantactinospora siamensis TaxID=555372 RepID=A0ABV6NU31_9ACTN